MVVAPFEVGLLGRTDDLRSVALVDVTWLFVSAADDDIPFRLTLLPKRPNIMLNGLKKTMSAMLANVDFVVDQQKVCVDHLERRSKW